MLKFKLYLNFQLKMNVNKHSNILKRNLKVSSEEEGNFLIQIEDENEPKFRL